MQYRSIHIPKEYLSNLGSNKYYVEGSPEWLGYLDPFDIVIIDKQEYQVSEVNEYAYNAVRIFLDRIL